MSPQQNAHCSSVRGSVVRSHFPLALCWHTGANCCMSVYNVDTSFYGVGLVSSLSSGGKTGGGAGNCGNLVLQAVLIP